MRTKEKQPKDSAGREGRRGGGGQTERQETVREKTEMRERERGARRKIMRKSIKDEHGKFLRVQTPVPNIPNEFSCCRPDRLGKLVKLFSFRIRAFNPEKKKEEDDTGNSTMRG